MKYLTILLALLTISLSHSQEGDATNFVYEPQLIPDVSVDRFQWGFDTGARRDSNIFLAPEAGTVSPNGNVSAGEQEGYVYNFSPDFLYRVLGDQFTAHSVVLGYGLDVLYNDVNDDLDVNQDANLDYRYQTGRSVFQLGASYSRIDGITGTDFGRFGDALSIREVGRSQRENFGFTTALDYRISSNLALDFNYGFQDQDFDAPNLNGYQAHGGQIGLLYGSGRLNVGPYVGYNVINGDNNVDQEGYQIGGTARWEYSAVTNFFAQVGYDERSFDGGDAASDRSSVVWSAGVDWHPSAYTSARLSFDRTILPSASRNFQNFETSSVRLGIKKEFLSHYFARFIGSYAFTDYDSNVTGGGRSDETENYYSAYVEIGRKLSDYGQISAFFSYLDNDGSDEVDFGTQSFTNESIGVRLSVDF